VDALTPTALPSDPTAALGLANALARTRGLAAAELWTDGNLPPRLDLDLACPLALHLVPPGGANLGITGAAARSRPDGAWDLLVTIAASAPATGRLVLRDGDAELARRSVAPGAGRSERLVLRVPPGGARTLALTLEPDGFDALAADDAAWIALPAARPLRALVDPRQAALRRALAALPEVTLVAEPPCDLAIGGGAIAAPVRLFTATPPGAEGLVAVEDGNAAIIDWERHAPLLRHVELGDIALARRPRWAVADGAARAEALGWRPLAEAATGPLLLAAPRGSGLDVWCTVDPERTTLPWRVALPVLSCNLAGLAAAAAGLRDAAAAPTGTLPALAFPAGATATVAGPDGARATATVGADGLLAGVSAPVPGAWRITAGDANATVGVALLAERETGLTAVERLALREVPVAAATARNEGRALWTLLAALAGAVLLMEWAWAHRAPRR
jgi:hypothetical protein